MFKITKIVLGLNILTVQNANNLAGQQAGTAILNLKVDKVTISFSSKKKITNLTSTSRVSRVTENT